MPPLGKKTKKHQSMTQYDSFGILPQASVASDELYLSDAPNIDYARKAANGEMAYVVNQLFQEFLSIHNKQQIRQQRESSAQEWAEDLPLLEPYDSKCASIPYLPGKAIDYSLDAVDTSDYISMGVWSVPKSTVSTIDTIGSYLPALSELNFIPTENPFHKIAPSVSFITGVISLLNGLFEVNKYQKRTAALLFLLKLMSMVEAISNQNLNRTREQLTTLRNGHYSEIELLKSFDITSEWSPFYWFAYKYRKTDFVETRAYNEYVLMPVLATFSGLFAVLAAVTAPAVPLSTIFSMISVGFAIPSVALSAPYMAHRISKYHNSNAAFIEYVNRGMIPENDVYELSQYISVVHKFAGVFHHRPLSSPYSPDHVVAQRRETAGWKSKIPFVRETTPSKGITLGDWYRYKISILLDEAFCRGFLDLEYEKRYITNIEYHASQGVKEQVTRNLFGAATDPGEILLQKLITDLQAQATDLMTSFEERRDGTGRSESHTPFGLHGGTTGFGNTTQRINQVLKYIMIRGVWNVIRADAKFDIKIRVVLNSYAKLLPTDVELNLYANKSWEQKSHLFVANSFSRRKLLFNLLRKNA